MGKKIGLVVNPVAGGWSPSDPETWGGGEEVIVGFSRECVRRGHEVTVFWEGAACDAHGIAFRPYQEARPGQMDVAIFFKTPEQGGQIQLAPRQFLWTDQERPIDPDPFERVLVCSPYLARHTAARMPRAIERLDVLPYGIDLDELLSTPTARVDDLVVHAASPDRGLKPLLDAWELNPPPARLRIAYGWELFDKCGGSPQLKADICDAITRLKERGVDIEMRRYSRAELNLLLRAATVYLYVCTGGEQFGLTAMKAQACGAIPVVKPWGALHDTVTTGMKVGDAAEALDAVRAILSTTALRESLRQELAQYQPITWAHVVDQWEDLWAQPAQVTPLQRAIREMPGAPHFASDIGWNLGHACAGTVQAFLGAAKPQQVYIDPALGFMPGNTTDPSRADAVILGWRIEDAPTSPAETLAAMHIRPNTPILVISSTGRWRAEHRARYLLRRDLAELFGGCPSYETAGLMLDGELNGILLSQFRYQPQRIGTRNLARVARTSAPRETVTACFMARNAAKDFRRCLDSIAGLVDAVVIADTGSMDETIAVAQTWGQETRIPVTVRRGTSPRFCYDCGEEHPIGEMHFGHRFAGFETARNQSLVDVDTDWFLWLDCDELLHHPERFDKYLRPSVFAGYSIQQHHHSAEPADARKTDFPVRLVRVKRDPSQPVGLHAYGPLAWPTYGTGMTVRFGGVVHEHPGGWPNYVEGLGPCTILGDGHITHLGYLTEDARRRRFVRNWPLMVADRMKYPDRRLGAFLMMRDQVHQMRYLAELFGGQVPPVALQLAEEVERVYEERFVNAVDNFAADAMNFVTAARSMRQQGFELTLSLRAKKPEATGDFQVAIDLSGRVRDLEEVLSHLRARAGEFDIWTGEYV